MTRAGEEGLESELPGQGDLSCLTGPLSPRRVGKVFRGSEGRSGWSLNFICFK